MGANSRIPLLPAPTESIVDTISGSTTGTDLATDLSRRTDKTSYSIPDDGSPVTIPIRRGNHIKDDLRLPNAPLNSQTSLLIEYFEGGKLSCGLASRPTIRVRVTPSKRSKEQRDQIQTSEANGGSKPSYSHRISIIPPSKLKQLDDSDLGAYPSNSTAGENLSSSRRLPLGIELVNRDEASELSTCSRDTRFINPTSDISSMPPDSLLETSPSDLRRKRSQSPERPDGVSPSKDLLETPSKQRSRSLSKERIAHRVAEKLNNPHKREPISKYQQPEKAKRDYKDLSVNSKSPKRLSNGHRDEKFTSPVSSLLTNSAVSSRGRSGDQYSIRTGTSKSSINPKLLETVEDAIRRLILPELKELKKDQKVISNISRFERDMNISYLSAGSLPRNELTRRLSKHASAPNVSIPRVALGNNSKDKSIMLAGNSTSREQEQNIDTGSEFSEASCIRRGNRPELTEQDKIRRQKSKGLRDAQAAGIVGTALTSAALKHHSSKSSLDKAESKKVDDCRSVIEGVNETELVFRKHNVPFLPLRSEIDSELTRDSLLSQRTQETETLPEDFRTSDISSRSLEKIPSPASRTSSRTPLGSSYELDVRHANLSSRNLSTRDTSDNNSEDRSRSPLDSVATDVIAAAAAANLLDAHPERHDSNFDRRLSLSPIQSVASEQSETCRKQHSLQQDSYGHAESLEIEPRLSIGSLSSAPSTNLARSTRPDNSSLRSQNRDLRQQDEGGLDLGYRRNHTQSGKENWTGSSEADERRRLGSSNTDDALMANGKAGGGDYYMGNDRKGRSITNGAAANPEFVHQAAVESAVASLLDPSVLGPSALDSSTLLENRSAPGPSEQQGDTRPKSVEVIPEAYIRGRGSPLEQHKDYASLDATSFPGRMGAVSPPQSVTQSIEDHDELGRTILDARDIRSPFPDTDHSLDSESEINTNPSIIQGPAGRFSHDSEEHWTYDTAPLNAGKEPHFGKASESITGVQADYKQGHYAEIPDGLYGARGYFDRNGASQPEDNSYIPSFGGKSNHYTTASDSLSSDCAPRPVNKSFDGIDKNGTGRFDSPTGDDLFAPSHQRQVSGYSYGVDSPLYDAATGRGIERIQSKDIIALMDHLTVRDAQRNARDTEILVTLVRSAAEMRNSFEEMKKFIAEQDAIIMENSDKQHDKAYRALGERQILGPRARQTPVATDDIRAKRENVFRRALKGLSLKSSNDLARVEEMLEQLLEEVECLRIAQDDRLAPGDEQRQTNKTRGSCETEIPLSSPDGRHIRNSLQSEYDSRDGQRVSVDRPSTVQGMDTGINFSEREEFLSPRAGARDQKSHHGKGNSALPETSPRQPILPEGLNSGVLASADEKGNRSKVSFLPKISRWSKNAASSMGDNLRNSIQTGRKDRPYVDVHRPGTELNMGLYGAPNFYDPEGNNRVRSNNTLENQQENRPPSPLVPSQVSETPKYQAHRDNLNLQHPQPRQGPSDRYQSQLENRVQDYGSPVPPNSDPWSSSPSLPGVSPNQQRFGGSRLSPISDTGLSGRSSRTERQLAPPRPPKIRDNGPLVPGRPPKSGNDEGFYAGRTPSQGSTLRMSPHSNGTVRKPTGPRPLTSGRNSPNKAKRMVYQEGLKQINDEIDY